jgi:hypothetical protein
MITHHQEVRLGASRDLLLLDNGGSLAPSSSSSSSSSVSASNTLGMLDLAEVAAQTLIQDVPNITFTVTEAQVQAQTDDALAGEALDRVSRRTYYGILDMDDADMRSSYMIKPAEQYKLQMEEDKQLENYWLRRLQKLPKDTTL